MFKVNIPFNKPVRLAAFLMTLSACVVADGGGGYTAFVLRSGTVACSKDADVTCELSAAAWVNGQDGSSELIFANDKPPKSPLLSSVFSVRGLGEGGFQKNEPVNYSAPALQHARKFEAMAVSPDRRYVVAMTGFDRYNETDPEMDRYSTLIYWPVSFPDMASVVMTGERSGVASSFALRSVLLESLLARFGLDKSYFKIEGLTLLPDQRILIGVREVGKSHKDFQYKVTLLQLRYSICDGRIKLDNEQGVDNVIDLTEAIQAQLGRPVGVSSLEYDPVNKRVYMLTSYEDQQNGLGAYLWVLEPGGGDAFLRPVLVRTLDGLPFVFPHKAEGLAVAPDGRLLVIHDDDRVLTPVRVDSAQGGQLRPRGVNEAPYDLLRICRTNPDGSLAAGECR